SPPEAWRPVDVTLIASAHGGSMGVTPKLLEAGGRVIDLTSDFRLKDPGLYPAYYRTEHPRPDLLASAVYGLPERHRAEIRNARLVANPGCMAAASILALGPLVTAGLVDPQRPVVVDAKSGSSASGRDGGPASLHPERSGVMRLYAPAGHRHTAEIEQET
ncbi:N-acetyl-gamma-glutamyl-phosphate reductase, partial [mine drainage metagenome]